jgi:hypothetical protein
MHSTSLIYDNVITLNFVSIITVMQLTENFTLQELTSSPTADKLGIKNVPDLKQEAALKLLAEKILQPLRDGIGVPIKINSGLRGVALNKAIGGSSTSQHCKGEAADLSLKSKKNGNALLFHYIRENLVFDQMIWEFGTKSNPDWVHVSYSAKGNRKEILEAYKHHGKTSYRLWKP